MSLQNQEDVSINISGYNFGDSINISLGFVMGCKVDIGFSESKPAKPVKAGAQKQDELPKLKQASPRYRK